MSIVSISSTPIRRRGRDGPQRAPGQHERTIVLRLRMRTLLALGFLAIVTGALGRAFGLRSPLFVGSELALLVSMFVVSRFVLPLVERHDRGATGEEQVGRLLDSLAAQGWRTVHDVSLQHGNVDHIAIGPAGLFAIETKSHPGPIDLQRIHGATFRQAHSHGEALERLTGERVERLIVYSRAWVDRPLTRRRGVRVLPARMLVGYLSRQRAALSAEQIDKAHRLVVAASAGNQRHGARLRRWQPPSPMRN
jgi:Nuclease-related domain